MKKKIVKGCIIFMLICLSGCGKSGNVDTESVAENVEVTEEIPVQEDSEQEHSKQEDMEPDTGKDVEEEQEITEEQSLGTVSGQMSDDLFSFQIQVGEDIFEVPCTYQDFAEKGYVCEEPDMEELESGLCLVRQEFVKGDTVLLLEVVNLTGDTQPIENCSVTAVGVDDTYMKGADYAKIFLPKGIQFSVSNKDDILAAYGEPSELYEGMGDRNYCTMIYTKDFFQKIEIMIDGEKNAICDIKVQNMPQ